MQLEHFSAFARPDLGPRTVMLRSLLPMVAEHAARTWIHCAVVGEWLGHADGAFEFDQSALKSICKNFNRQKNPIVLTYEHPRDYGDGLPKPAAGWVHELAIKPDGLWAHVEFTERSASLIRNGEYRYCSVVVVFNSTDRESGQPCGVEIRQIGLTNDPFIDGMQPIRLSRACGDKQTRSLSMAEVNTKDILKKALKELPDDAPIERYVQYIEAEAAKQRAIEGAGGEAPGEPDAAASAAASREDDKAETTKLSEQDAVLAADPVAAVETEAMTILKQALNLDAAGVIQWLRDNAPKLADLAGVAPSETADSAFSRTHVSKDVFDALANELKLAREQIAPLKTKVDDGAKERAQKDAEARVDALITENRKTGFAEGERQRLVAMARERPKDFETLRESLPPMAVPFGDVTERVDRTGERALSSSRATSKDDEETDLTPRDDTERLITGQIYDAALQARALKNHRAKQLTRTH